MSETDNNGSNETFAHSDFRIGTAFYTESALWRCTDIGTRTIVAVKIKDGYPSSSISHHFSTLSRWCSTSTISTACIADR